MSYSLSFSQAIFTVLFVGDKVGQGFYDFVPTKELSASLNIPNPTAVKILGNLRPTHKARAAAAFRKYPEFRDLQLVTSDITLKDIVGNFGEYLARHDSKDARKILNKIQNEFSRGGKKNPSGNRPSDRS